MQLAWGARLAAEREEHRDDGQPSAVGDLPDNGNPPQDSGHVMLEWSADGIVNAVGVHTDTPVNRSRALFIAQHLVLIEPSSEG